MKIWKKAVVHLTKCRKTLLDCINERERVFLLSWRYLIPEVFRTIYGNISPEKIGHKVIMMKIPVI